MKNGFVPALLEEMINTNIEVFMLNVPLYPVQELFAAAIICHQRKLMSKCGNKNNLVTSTLVASIDQVRCHGFCSQLSAVLSLDLMIMFAHKTEKSYTEAACIKAS